MTLEEKQQELIEEFAMFEDWESKYNYLIELGKDLPSMKEEHKTEENEVHGCLSRVWVRTTIDNNKMYFAADSEGLIPKGIIALLVRVLNDESPEKIATCDMEFIREIGLDEHLMHTRSNGLANMVKKMKMSALLALQA